MIVLAATVAASAAPSVADEVAELRRLVDERNIRINGGWALGENWDAADARRQIQVLLKKRFESIEPICELTDAQKRKLELAAQGDIRRLLDAVEDFRDRFERVRQNAAQAADLVRDMEPLRQRITSEPFGADSLFEKSLHATLTAAQMGRYQPLQWIFQVGGQVRRTTRGSESVFEVDLSGTTVDDQALARLPGVTDVQWLDLRNTAVSDAGMQHLARCQELRWLWLYDTRVTNRGLEDLKGLTNLRELGLCNTRVAGDGLAHLSKLTELRALNLSGTAVADDGLDSLKALRNLKYLYLTRTKITPAGIADLKRTLPDVQIWK